MTSSASLESILKSIQLGIKFSKSSGIDKALASEIIKGFGKEQGITAARIWKVGNKDLTLIAQEGGRKSLKAGFKLPISNYSIVQDTLLHGYCVMNKDHPGFNHEIESRIGSENFLSIKLSPKTILSVELDDIRRARSAAHLIKRSLDYHLNEKEIENINSFARNLEQSLLPKQEDITQLNENYDVTWYARPAIQVRGDYLSFKTMKGNSSSIIIGDASGKGITAAVTALSAHSSIDAQTESNPRAAVLMETLNNTLYRLAITNDYMTMFYSTLHKDGRINYVNAGHPYPMLFHKKGVENLDIGGYPLGLFPKAEYSPGSAYMEKGDILFVYTDGLSEAKNKRDIELGISKLESLIGKNKHLSPKEIKNSIKREVREFIYPKGFHDDVTYAIIKKKN